MAFSTSSIAAIKGDTGAQGVQGAQGDTGPAGSIDLTADQAWTGSQRATFPPEVTDGTLDMSAANNFLYDPASSPDELGFSNITNGQSGYIVLDNGGDTITLAGHVNSAGGTGATDLSTTGPHLINYVTDGTTVYITYGLNFS